MATSSTMMAKGFRPPLEGSSEARDTFSLCSLATSSGWVSGVGCQTGWGAVSASSVRHRRRIIHFKGRGAPEQQPP